MDSQSQQTLLLNEAVNNMKLRNFEAAIPILCKVQLMDPSNLFPSLLRDFCYFLSGKEPTGNGYGNGINMSIPHRDFQYTATSLSIVAIWSMRRGDEGRSRDVALLLRKYCLFFLNHYGDLSEYSETIDIIEYCMNISNAALSDDPFGNIEQLQFPYLLLNRFGVDVNQ